MNSFDAQRIDFHFAIPPEYSQEPLTCWRVMPRPPQQFADFDGMNSAPLKKTLL